MSMTLLFDERCAFFAERGQNLVRNLSIRLPEGAALLCNGTGYFPRGESVQLPPAALRQGENTLALRIANRIFPCEGLLFDGTFVTPMGFSLEGVLLRQHEVITEQRRALSALTRRVALLEQKNKAKTLFS